MVIWNCLFFSLPIYFCSYLLVRQVKLINKIKKVKVNYQPCLLLDKYLHRSFLHTNPPNQLEIHFSIINNSSDAGDARVTALWPSHKGNRASLKWLAMSVGKMSISTFQLCNFSTKWHIGVQISLFNAQWFYTLLCFTWYLIYRVLIIVA